jgi:hypothetical protein
MDRTLYEKVEEVKDRFYELYGKDIYTDFTLPEKVTNAYYEINDLLLAILNDIEMEGYDSAEQ